MNMLARPGKASVPAPTDTAPEVPRTLPMAQEQVTPAPVRANVGPSLIGAGLTVVGRLDCAGDLQIEGRIEGEVRAQGVRIGNGAIVKGTVAAEIVQVAGTIDGNIEAESVIVARTARISGDIAYRSLQIDEGAYFSGTGKPRRKEATPRQRAEVLDGGAAKGCYVAPLEASTAPASESVN